MVRSWWSRSPSSRRTSPTVAQMSVLSSIVDSISSGLTWVSPFARSRIRGAPETRFFVSGSRICSSSSTGAFRGSMQHEARMEVS